MSGVPIESGITSIDPSGVAHFGDPDKSLIVQFYADKKQDFAASQKAGTPIFVHKDMVRVIQIGEKDVAEYEADRGHPPYKYRWPRQWEAYQKGMEQRVAGTPLDMLFPTQPEIVATLAALHIQTIQQLADISDTAIGNIPFGRQYVQTAKQYLGRASGSAEFHSLKDENAALREEMAAMRKQLEAMAAKADEAPKANAGGFGRVKGSRKGPDGKFYAPGDPNAPPGTFEGEAA